MMGLEVGKNGVNPIRNGVNYSGPLPQKGVIPLPHF